MFKKLKAWWQLKRAQHSEFYAPPAEPAVDRTTAKPRHNIKQDIERTATIEKMLAGALVPGKRLVRFEIVAHYSDGAKQVLREETSPYTKVHVEVMADGTMHYIVDTSRLNETSVWADKLKKTEEQSNSL